MSEENIIKMLNNFPQIETVKYILEIQEENKELKKQVEIKNSGFMASIEEVCQYAIVLTEFEKWLENELFNKTQILAQYSSALRKCYDKLQELKEVNKQ